MISEAFIDLDDTLNMFSPYALSYAGCPVDPQNYIGEPQFRGSYDLVARVNSYRPEDQQYTIPDFWESIPKDFWAHTPKAPEFQGILDYCEELVGKDKVFILTAPTKDPLCLAGKLEWIHTYLPSHYHRQYFITPRKYVLARSGRLMVDDSETNLVEWRASGGTPLRVPRPWNAGWDLAERGLTWAYMKDKFEFMLQGNLEHNPLTCGW